MQRKCSLHCPDPKAAWSKAQICPSALGGTESCLESVRADLTCLTSWCCQFRLFHTELFLGITRDSPLHLLPHTCWRNPLCSLFSVLTSPGFLGFYPGRDCRCSHGCLSSPFPFSCGQRQQQMLSLPVALPGARGAGLAAVALLCCCPLATQSRASQTAGVSVPAEPARGKHSSQRCVGS